MNRRTFINNLGCGAISTALGFASGCSRNSPVGGNRPSNILLITADDLGFSDLGCYGGEIATPNLDQLAFTGLRFRNAYNCAVCVPTRAALMTGLHPHQALEGGGFENFGDLRLDVPTIGELLRENAYQTYLSGKWHLGTGSKRPLARGFDRFFGIESGASNYFKSEDIRPTPVFLDDEPIELDDEFYMTDAISDHATRFISEASNSSNPFFLHLSYTAPHFPLHARPEDIGKYRNRYMMGWDRLRKERYARQVEIGLFDGSWSMSPREELKVDLDWDELSEEAKSDWDLRMAVYAAQVEVMDQGVGRVVRKLKDTGLRDNTLILFMSDNGACASRLFETRDGKKAMGVPAGPADSYVAYGLWWANASNTPFRLYKTLLHEGGIATPMIANWPGVIAAKGEYNDALLHVADIPATCLDIAAGRNPDSNTNESANTLEGRSFLPVLRGHLQDPGRSVCWNLWGNQAIRQDEWKLVLRSNRLIESSFGRWRYEPAPHEEAWELYNLEADRTETNNLARARPEILETLSQRYREWAKRTGISESAIQG